MRTIEIRRVDSYNPTLFVDDEKIPWPTITEVRPFLTMAITVRRREASRLCHCWLGSVSDGMMLQAIAGVLAMRESLVEYNSGQNTTLTLPPEWSSPMFASIGNAIYQLQPVKVLDRPAKALELYRKQARAEVKSIIAASEAVAARAEARAAQIIRAAEAELMAQRSRTNIVELPPWFQTLGSEESIVIPGYSNRASKLALQFPIRLPVSSFSCLGHIWAANILPQPAPWTVIQVPLEGRGNKLLPLWNQIRLVTYDGKMHPHINTSTACLSPGEAVELENRSDIEHLKRVIARTLSAINLASVLSSPITWHKYYSDCLPEPLQFVKSRREGADSLRVVIQGILPQVADPAPSTESTWAVPRVGTSS